MYISAVDQQCQFPAPPLPVTLQFGIGAGTDLQRTCRRIRAIPIVFLGTLVVECRNWDAWTKRNPALPSILYVHADCECPAGGYTIELRRAPEQESDPAVLVLDLIISTPPDHEPKAPQLIEVQYWESTSQEYQEVRIRPGNIVLKVSQAT